LNLSSPCSRSNASETAKPKSPGPIVPNTPIRANVSMLADALLRESSTPNSR
jgi:hypothetical protein